MTEVIQKTRVPGSAAPNLADLEQARSTFRWDAARAELEGLPGGRGLNIAHEAVDRHARGARRDRVALRWRGQDGGRRELTFGWLAGETSRFAGALARRGVGAGDAVFVLTGRIPELHVAVLGALKNRCIASPLFAAFGPEPLRARLALGRARALVTTPALYRRKVAPLRAALPALEHVFLVGAGAPPLPPGTTSFEAALAAESPLFDIPPTRPDDVALYHFTSGTTGAPKAAVHVHEAIVAHRITARWALDLRDDDVFWCTADPGWVTGTSYGILAPLSLGITSLLDEGEFDAERWYDVLDEERVTVWYTAPTAVRMMMKAGAERARARRPRPLRFVASVGEPLAAEAVRWGVAALGLPIHDNWWQTETGAILIANTEAAGIKPGSMGRPLPGIDAAIVHRTEDGGVEVLEEGRQGELAIRPGWPSMFRGYLNDPERTAKCFRGGWYLTGDLARRDADGYFWFVGRADDVIKSAGHLIGPFEVESALLEHPAVAEAGVIGKPDPVAMEIVKAFVSLRAGHEASPELSAELLGFARSRLGASMAPREIEIVTTLPRTRSGKIMRRLLKARELGLPEGDTSTLEDAS